MLNYFVAVLGAAALFDLICAGVLLWRSRSSGNQWRRWS